MKIRLYNSLTRQKEAFVPLRDGRVSIYSCGPTVYDFAHIGNLRTYIFSDTLRRTFEWFGFSVIHVVNITDVGHLLEDSGEDRIEVGARREKKSAQQIARFYEKVFFSDLKKLNILKPHHAPRASENIPEMIELIKRLENKGLTYTTPEGVYFDTEKWPKYGLLSRQKLNDKHPGARVERSSLKRNPLDFALWRLTPPGQFRQMEWDSPWGRGFPGWHIECSAMSVKYLGQPFDIHTGGIDHLPVHHENEIAQSQAAGNKPLANYWLHAEHLMINGARMGKSEGNIVILDDLIKKGFSPPAFRLEMLLGHYRSPMNFTWQALASAAEQLVNLEEFARKMAWRSSVRASADSSSQSKTPLDSRFHKRIEEALCDDLNTPRVIAELFSLIKKANTVFDDGRLSAKQAEALLEAVMETMPILGLRPVSFDPAAITQRGRRLIDEREQLRRQKKFARADQIRRRLQQLGYHIEDTPYGPYITPSLTRKQ